VFNLCSTEQSCILIGITCYKIGTLANNFEPALKYQNFLTSLEIPQLYVLALALCVLILVFLNYFHWRRTLNFQLLSYLLLQLLRICTVVANQDCHSHLTDFTNTKFKMADLISAEEKVCLFVINFFILLVCYL
jgi:hypothetical protein